MKDPDEQTEDTSDTSSPVEETSETDSSTDDTGRIPIQMIWVKKIHQRVRREEDDRQDPLTSSEDSKVIEAVIDVEINTQPTSNDSVDNDTEDDDTQLK